MKSLIACASIALAITCQAATANWTITCSNIYNGGGDKAVKVSSATAYIFDAGKISQSLLFDALCKGTVATEATGYITSKSVASGSFVATSGANQFSYGEQSTADDKVYQSYFFAIVDGKNVYLSKSLENVAANANATAKALSFGTAAPTTGATSKSLPTSGFVAVGQWATMSVPEPTSGLLVMLGVGLMALRRRRA